MNKIRIFALLVITLAFLAGCKNASHRKTAGGMPYKVYEGKGNKKIMPGNFIKVHFSQKIKDSVYFTTFDKLPMYLRVNEQPDPYDLSEIWAQLKVGDSVVTTQMMDTFIRRKPENVPPNFKKGDMINTYIRILDVFATDSLARMDNEKVKADWLNNEIAFLEKYLKEKNIPVQKTQSGAFVEIIEPGTGNLGDSGKYVSVNYTGTSFSGKVFDSNTDSSFQHVAPISFTVGNKEMIVGFDESVRFLRKGGRAKVYVPSLLGYGGNPNSPSIKPFEHLIFDVTLLEVSDKPQPSERLNPVFPGKN